MLGLAFYALHDGDLGGEVLLQIFEIRDVHVVQAKKGSVINWPEAVEVSKTYLCNLQLPVQLLACPSFIEFMRHPIRVRKQSIDDNNPTSMFASKVRGGKHPENFCYEHDQIAQNPGDGSIGLLIFGDDFAMVDTSMISNETIFLCSQDDKESIANKETAMRAGIAGGSFRFSLENTDHDVKSLSIATPKVPGLSLPPRTGIPQPCVYPMSILPPIKARNQS